MAGIPTSNILQPGLISVAEGVTQALVSDLQLLTPQYYNRYTEKYGNERYTQWLSQFGGMEIVKNQEFFWFENRGKNQEAITIAAGATSTAGSTISLTLAAEDHYNSGTQSPLREKETLRLSSTNTEWEIMEITGNTPYAFTFTVRPKQVITATIATGDIFLFGGYVDAGEASDSIDPLIHLDNKYTNTITEIRDTARATDLAGMTDVFYSSGVTGDEFAGGAQSGTSYFTYKSLVKTNTRFLNSVEFKLMRGNTVTNTGMNGSNSVGTQGFIPKVLADGETVGYTPGTLDIAKIHEITRIMDVNGCARQNAWMMDIYQSQNFDDGIFKEYPAGAFQWGSKAASQEAAIAYGMESFKIDGYLFQKKTYRPYNTEYTTGKTPTTDRFRNFGQICPLSGETVDAKNAERSYRNITVMTQTPPAGGTTGNSIRVWPHGGGSRNPSNGLMVDNVEMITYQGLRVCAANMFVNVQAQ